MGQQAVYEDTILPIAQKPFDQVTTVLICSNSLLRSGIAVILEGSRFVLAEQTDGDFADSPACSDVLPALFVICDGSAPEEHARTIGRLKTQCPSAKAVVVADNMAPQDVLMLCEIGLDGYCPSNMKPRAMVKALELVMQGERFVPAAVILRMLNEVRSVRQPRSEAAILKLPQCDEGSRLSRLSERETQILRLLTQGSSNKLIARELGLAEATIKVHLKAILRKLRASNRTQAAIWAREHFGDAMAGIDVSS